MAHAARTQRLFEALATWPQPIPLAPRRGCCRNLGLLLPRRLRLGGALSITPDHHDTQEGANNC